MTETAAWWRKGVIYQVYPRSFSDSDDSGLGDLPGITARLDYLAELGVDALWLSPIYPSPDADFGYDISDYTAVDPRFGSLADFDRLVSEAHRRGIRLILDLVLNHTSDQHPWFKASRSSRSDPRRDWYIWSDPKPGGGRPNNWQSVFGGPGWEWDAETGQYFFHMFVPQQPDLNYQNPEVQQAVLDVVRFWLDRGVDGFRLDVFNAYFKHPDLLDNPPALGLRGFDRQHHVNDISRPELLGFLKRLRALIDSYPERYLVGETFIEGVEGAARYCGPELLHAAFNFDFTHSAWDARRLLGSIERWERLLGPHNWPNYVFNNHDLPRTATRWRTKDDDRQLKAAATLLLTLRGTPFLYYGEEIGMRDIHLRRSEILDPPGKRFWPFYKGRDGCRSPMQWDTTENAGFSPARPWLPVHPGYPERNVAVQRSDRDSLFNFYRQLIGLRRSMPALSLGSFRVLTPAPRSALAYLREAPGQAALVAINFSARPADVPLTGLPEGTAWEPCLSSVPGSTPQIRQARVMLQSYEGAIFIRSMG